jgi:4-hydroxy-3-polyprenylbenzoate decarboxylase
LLNVGRLTFAPSLTQCKLLDEGMGHIHYAWLSALRYHWNPLNTAMRKLIVGMTGASGAIFGVRLLQTLQDSDIETYLVASKWAQQTIEHETGKRFAEVREMATASFNANDMGAAISSGSFHTAGMVVAPCSMRSLAAIANGFGEHLVHRAADVILKEHRRLVLVTRETPLNDLHLENMLKLSRMGVVILPPMPAFYNHPQTLDDMVDHIVARILDQFDIDLGYEGRWQGEMHVRTKRVRSQS